VGADASVTDVKSPPYGAGSFGSWTYIVYIPKNVRLGLTKEHVFFYSVAGIGFVGHFDTTSGNFVYEWASYGFAGWTHVVCTNWGYLFFYNNISGQHAEGYIADDGTFVQTGSGTIATGYTGVSVVGQECVLLTKAGSAALRYEINGAASSVPVVGSESAGWSSSNGLSLILNSDGSGIARGYCRFFGTQQVSANSFVDLRTFPAATFGTWEDVVALGVLT
jgi:hypothetical protein